MVDRLRTPIGQPLEAPRISVPRISYAEVAPVKPVPVEEPTISPVEAFTKTILPGVKKLFDKPAETGADILDQHINSFKQQITDLEETGKLTDVAFNRALSEQRSGFIQSLIKSGVDPKLYSGLRESFNFALAKDERFTYEKKENCTVVFDGETGQTTVRANDWRTLAEIAYADTMVGMSAYDKNRIAQLPEEQQRPFIENKMYQEKQKEALMQENAFYKATNENLQWSREIHQEKNRQQYLRTRGSVITNIFNPEVQRLKDDVAAGIITAEEAKGLFNTFFDNTFRTDYKTMQSFLDLGYSPDTTATELSSMKDSAYLFFEAHDPTKVLSREVLTERYKWDQYRFNLVNNLPPKTKGAVATGEYIKDAVMTHYYFKEVEDIDLPEAALINASFGSENTKREFRNIYTDEALQPAPKNVAMAADHPFNKSANHVFRALENIILGWEREDLPIATVEDTIAMYEVLKENPNWQHLSSKQLLAFEKRFRKIKTVYVKSPQMQKLLERIVEEKKETWREWYERKYGKKEKEVIEE